jgi:hypothetical protein
MEKVIVGTQFPVNNARGVIGTLRQLETAFDENKVNESEY